MPDESDPADTTPFQRLTRNESLQTQPSLAFYQVYALPDLNLTIEERPRAGGLLPGGSIAALVLTPPVLQCIGSNWCNAWQELTARSQYHAFEEELVVNGERAGG